MPEPEEPIVAITVRFPESVAARAREQAKTDRRSLNSEIVYLVSTALDAIDAIQPPTQSGGEK